MANAEAEEYGEISCAVDHADDLNWPSFPDVGYYVGVEVPEAVLSAQEFIVIVADAGRPSQCLKSLIELRADTLRGVRAILGDIEKNLLKVVFRLWGEKEEASH